MLKICRTKSRIRGAGLVEVLVALIVIGVGMLGIASMYVTTLSAKTTSLSRTKAVNLAYEMADKIRANPTGGADYNLTLTDVTTATNCKTATCNPKQIAAADLDDWNATLTSSITGLPSVGRSVSFVESTNALVPDVYTITVQWTEKGIGTMNLSLPVQICSRKLPTGCKP